MRIPSGLHTFLRRVRLFPLSWLRLSLSSRLLFVAFSYVLGIAGRLFPLMLALPIRSTCR